MNTWRGWVTAVLLASPLLYVIYAVAGAFRDHRSQRTLPTPTDLDVHLSIEGTVAAKDSALDFPVKVNFRYTVLDPRVLADAPAGDLYAFLGGHVALEAFDRTYTDGHERDLSKAIAERLEQSLAYDTAPGIRVVLTSVEVDRASMEEA